MELLAHLGELESRKLHRGEGSGSLFSYCTGVLGLSEAAAWNRIRAARAGRRFPIVLDMIADGRVNLTTIRLLAPHLTAENHRAILEEARGMTRREVDKLVARLSPQPDVRSSVRKLPSCAPVAAAAAPMTQPIADAPVFAGPEPCAAAEPPAEPPDRRSDLLTPAPRGIVAPLSPARYKVAITVGEDAHDDLRWLQDALRREIPSGDPSEVVTQALRLMRREVEKKRFQATTSPRAGRAVSPGSRHVSAAVQRAVWTRDGGRCAFVGRKGRCSERSFLEYHHRHPAGYKGEATVENIALRCRAHNVYEAELVFGPLDRSRTRGRSPAPRGPGRMATGPGTSG